MEQDERRLTPTRHLVVNLQSVELDEATVGIGQGFHRLRITQRWDGDEERTGNENGCRHPYQYQKPSNATCHGTILAPNRLRFCPGMRTTSLHLQAVILSARSYCVNNHS